MDVCMASIISVFFCSCYGGDKLQKNSVKMGQDFFSKKVLIPRNFAGFLLFSAHLDSYIYLSTFTNEIPLNLCKFTSNCLAKSRSRT